MTERRTVLKFDAGASGFRRIVLVTAAFALLLLGSGAVVIISVLTL
ncbi:MAG: hypothetical protein OXQ31_03780 [Spirochaetaceae bacterium]|nr:hypothetical protein [Spirochaetaceae bacterium]